MGKQSKITSVLGSYYFLSVEKDKKAQCYNLAGIPEKIGTLTVIVRF
jgi:hypothetical protein